MIIVNTATQAPVHAMVLQPIHSILHLFPFSFIRQILGSGWSYEQFCRKSSFAEKISDAGRLSWKSFDRILHLRVCSSG